MSTRSNLAMEINGQWYQTYVHYDGYPSNMLPNLNNNFLQSEKAQELVEAGDLRYVDLDGSYEAYGVKSIKVNEPSRENDYLYVYVPGEGWVVKN